MDEVLRRVVAVSAGGVRAYLGGRPLGDITPKAVPEVSRSASEAGFGEVALISLAMSHLAVGRDTEAVRVLEPILERRPPSPPAVVSLLTLCYLLRDESVEATDGGGRRV